MPIQIPNLDDRNYDQLLKETAGVVARYFPEYADIGASDPAVAFNELFCYLFDISMYQQNRITADMRNNFAALLGIEPKYGQPPDEALRQGLAKLARIDRAITPGDIETVLKKASADRQLSSEPVRRVFVFPCQASGDIVRVFVVFVKNNDGKIVYSPPQDKHEGDMRSLYRYLRGCSPIDTRYEISHAPLLRVDVSANIVKRRDSTIGGDRLASDIADKLEASIDPLKGGASGHGWEFGKPVSRGDLYGLIEGTPGVDYVRSLMVKPSDQAYYDAGIDILPVPEGGVAWFQKNKASIAVS